MSRLRNITTYALLLVFTLVFCLPDDADAKKRRRRRGRRPPIINEKKLFERVGGISVIKKVSDEWSRKVLGDQRLNQEFEKLKSEPQAMARFRQWLYDQSCELADGPCEAKDLSGLEKVTWRGLSAKSQLIFFDQLAFVMDEFQLKEREKNEMISRWGHLEGPGGLSAEDAEEKL